MRSKVITTVLLLVAAYFVIFPPSFGNPFIPAKNYEGMQAVAIANENAPANVLVVINGLKDATARRNMTFRSYDEDQPAAKAILNVVDQEPPAIIIYDPTKKTVEDVYAMPESVEALEDVLGTVPE